LWIGSIVLRIVVWLLWPSVYAASNVTPLHFDPLMAGALVAWGMRDPIARARLAATAERAWPIVLGFMGLVAVFAATAHGAAIAPAALAFGALIIMVLNLPAEHWMRRTLRNRVFRSFGLYSYCLYVVHYPLIIALDRVIPRLRVPQLFGSNLPYALVYGVALVGISYAIAFTSYRLLERPLLSLKDLPKRHLA
jgi:peptidoglycan/LPS O-acetylase OafA/YrhL